MDAEVKMPVDEATAASEGEDAARDVLAAIAAKDAKALDKALARHYVCCEGDEPSEEDEEAPPSSKRY
jgi:hypothetical protein